MRLSIVTSLSFSTHWTFLLIILVLFLSACQPPTVSTPVRSSKDPTTVIPLNNWYQIYFSDPTNPNSETLRGGPDKPLADAIRQACLSVDIAAYELDLWSIRDALLDAHRRGVSVHLVTDSDNIDEREVQELKDAAFKCLAIGMRA